MRLAVVLLVALAAVACRGGIFGGRTTLTSKDGRHVLAVPVGWSSAPNLNEKAEIGAEDKVDELFAIVISEPKSGFSDMTLDKYSDTTRAALEKRLDGASESGPTELTVHARRAIEWQVSGRYDKIDLVYLHASIETKDRYNQVIAWTVKSRATLARPVLDDVIASFDEARDAGR
jgi:hypothetical protein